MSTPIVPADAPHAVKYDRPTETYRVLNAAGVIVDRYQHGSGDFPGRRAMYRLALEDAAVRDAAAARAEARAWMDACAAQQAAERDAERACEEAARAWMDMRAAKQAAERDADEAARNFSDEADEAAAQAMDAALDLTCACELCGGAVMPDEAALVGEQMACGWCAGKAQGIARFVARHGHAPGEPAAPPTGPRLLWSWAGNAAALRGLMDERHGLLSREAK